MKIKLLAFSFLLSSTLLLNSVHTQLVIPSVNIENPHWTFTGNIISQKEDGAFAQLVEKWDARLQACYKKLDNKIYEDIDASIAAIECCMKEKLFIDAYTHYCNKTCADFINTQEVIDPLVINFIELKLSYLQYDKPITFHASSNTPIPAISFGTNQTAHHIVINTNLYNSKKIQQIYDIEAQKTFQFYIAPYTNKHTSRVIEYTNLLHLGLTQALSNLVHQSDYFTKLLLFFTSENKALTQETQRYGIDLLHFHALLESALQSNNPLEIAIFVQPCFDPLKQEYLYLWHEFIDDIKNCYKQDDLQAYEALTFKERCNALYTNQE